MRPLTQCLVLSLSAPALALKYDYVIVGAGTSGLVLANRLSEDPSVKVAVIEPGADERDNPLVKNPDSFPLLFTTHLNWNYTTTPQQHADNRSIDLLSGRAWGGSSTINGMTYIRGTRDEIDLWQQLGNEGWNWDTLLPYYKKSEEFTRPNASQVSAGATYEIEHHGLDGSVHVGYRPLLTNASTSSLMIGTWENMLISLNPDFNSGDTRGFAIAPQTLDPSTDQRWDSAVAYLGPVLDRPNLDIIAGTVESITWNDKTDESKPCSGKLVASGVSYITPQGDTKTLEAGEVILSAGALRSPPILEASGIGNARYLSSIGIETKIDLPGVGAHLQEQCNNFVSLDGTLEPVIGSYIGYVTAKQLFGDDFERVKTKTRGDIPRWAKQIVDSSTPGALNITSLETHLRLQHDLLFEKDVPIGEILTVSVPGPILASNFWGLFPFSRGSVHLSPDDRDKPLVDPAFFQIDFDLEVTAALGNFTLNFWQTNPIGEFVSGRSVPPLEAVPLDATYEELAAWFRSTGTAGSHPIGTAAMMSRELGGVVDPELRVYGTRNVRVVDGSVLPMQFSGHPTATLYALAERAAEFIAADRR